MSDILFVTPTYVPFVGGARSFTETMAQRLAKDGHSVTVLTTTASRSADFWRPPDSSNVPLQPRETLAGVSVERLPLTYPWPAPLTFGLIRRASYWISQSGLPLGFQRRILEGLSQWTPPLRELKDTLDRLVSQADLIHALDSSWDGLFAAAAACARHHDKLFVAMPLMHLADPNADAHFKMIHQIDAYRAADAVLALSQREATAYESLGVYPERVHTIHMGVDPEVSHLSRGSHTFRRQHALVDAIVAFLGAQTYDKGALTLAQAVARLNQTGLPAHLVCAGPESDRLRAFIRSQPRDIQSILSDRSLILGTVNEETKHQLLADCDLLALPSRVDTFGIVLLEAGLHGKPVIGADAGGIPEVIEANHTGLLVPFGDASALADAIRRLVTRPKLASRLGEAGRQRVLGEFTWDNTFRSLRDIYARVLQGGER